MNDMIVIKLSGGALGTHDEKYEESTLQLLADQIGKVQEQGYKIGLIVGGGNLFRGKDLAGNLSVTQATADYIGMLATVQNALVLRDYFEARDMPTRISSAISMPQVCESYIPQKAKRHMEKGRIVIFAAGLGVPYFTTDSSAVQRALELGAERLVMAKDGVDGLYSGDPETDSSAKKIEEISAHEVLEQDLKVADASAIALAKDHGLPITITSIQNIASFKDEHVGSVVHPD